MMNRTPTPAFTLHDVHASLGGQPVLRGLRLEVAAGRWTSIVGPNGAGKSTLLSVLAALLPHSGSVQFMGQPLRTWPARQRARQLAWLGQDEPIAQDLTALDTVMLGRLPHQNWLARSNSADHAAVERAMRQTHTWQHRLRTLGELSGGERQRVLLARVLAVQAQFILLDEPLTNLDPPHQIQLLRIIRALTANGVTVISVLHEIAMALHADAMLILQDGQAIHHGSCADIHTHRALEQVFGHCLHIREVDGQWAVLPRTATPRAEQIPSPLFQE